VPSLSHSPQHRCPYWCHPTPTPEHLTTTARHHASLTTLTCQYHLLTTLTPAMPPPTPLTTPVPTPVPSHPPHVK